MARLSSRRRRSGSRSATTCRLLTLRTDHATPLWGADAELDALLTNAAGSPIQGGVLKLQRLNGSAWQNVRLGVTGADGAAVLLYTPGAATTLRVVFAPPADAAGGP